MSAKKSTKIEFFQCAQVLCDPKMMDEVNDIRNNIDAVSEHDADLANLLLQVADLNQKIYDHCMKKYGT